MMIPSFNAYPTYVAPRRTWRAPRGVSSRPLEPSHRALRAQSLRGHNGEVVRCEKNEGCFRVCYFIHLLTSSRETATSVSDGPYAPVEMEYRNAVFSSGASMIETRSYLPRVKKVSWNFTPHFSASALFLSTSSLCALLGGFFSFTSLMNHIQNVDVRIVFNDVPLSHGVQRLVIRCADCNCSPDECRASKSPRDCPNCRLDECCCWSSARKWRA